MLKKSLLLSLLFIGIMNAMDKEALKKQIMCSIEECSVDKFLQVTNNLEEIKNISPDEWNVFCKQAEFQYKTIYGLEKNKYIKSKILCGFLLLLCPLSIASYPERNYNRNYELGDKFMDGFFFITTILSATMGVYGLVVDWKSDKADKIRKIIDYKIKTIQDMLDSSN